LHVSVEFYERVNSAARASHFGALFCFYQAHGLLAREIFSPFIPSQYRNWGVVVFVVYFIVLLAKKNHILGEGRHL
jgi:hypothetical protein